MNLTKRGMEFFKNLVDILKSIKKSFIIYSTWKGVNFYESLVDILKTK